MCHILSKFHCDSVYQTVGWILYQMKLKIKQLVRWVFFTIFLILLVHYICNHWNEFSFLGRLNYIYIIPITLISFALLLLSSYRFFLIIKKLNRDVPFVYVFQIQVMGRFFSRIIPQSGVIYKAHAFEKRGYLGYGPLFSSLISFTWMDLMITSILCTSIVSIYQPELEFGGFRAFEFFLIISATLLSSTLIVFMVSNKIAPVTFSKIMPLWRIYNRIFIRIREGLKLISDPRLITGGILIILAEILFSILRLYFCFSLIGYSTEFSMLLVFITVSRILNVINITPGNFGLREFVFGYLSNLMETGISQGIFISLKIRAIEFILLGCLVCLFTFFLKLNRRR